MPNANRAALVFVPNPIKNGPSRESRFQGVGGQYLLIHAMTVARATVLTT